MSSTILVSGATGTQGGAVARVLLEHGHSVRAMTRRPDGDAARALSALGAEIVAADFNDPATLRAAASGVDAVYAMGTPYESDAETEERQANALLDAAVAAGVEFIVYSSVASALDDSKVPHFESKARVEQHLETLAVANTVVAPAMFTDNILAPNNAESLAAGRYAFPVPADVRVQKVAISDLAEFTALVFDDPQRFTGQRIELASSDETGAGVATALTHVLGREIEYSEVPLEAVEASGNEDLASMMRFLRGHGYTVDIEALHAAYPEIGWHTVESWAREQSW
ncbi:NmrA/HSCARG family protein [Paramicrobacterium fandaimingii]|uniref:NmrA/HSCARG family protein n=1 Tax=Paramicrobacterium fandaimingii TaxID=2708079 RepID=UPI0014223EAF|nr:NmrA/HSCARG family protein [Microbacterium fandaimingii]